MLWTLLSILPVLWLLGLLGSVGGSLVHLLLLAAVIALLVQLITGRRPERGHAALSRAVPNQHSQPSTPTGVVM